MCVCQVLGSTLCQCQVVRCSNVKVNGSAQEMLGVLVGAARFLNDFHTRRAPNCVLAMSECYELQVLVRTPNGVGLAPRQELPMVCTLTSRSLRFSMTRRNGSKGSLTNCSVTALQNLRCLCPMAQGAGNRTSARQTCAACICFTRKLFERRAW